MIKAEVKAWGNTIGYVVWNEDGQCASFCYSDNAIRRGLEFSPISMPLKPGEYSFPSLSKETFNGLPGLLSDSLPDRFGNKVIARWLEKHKRGALNPIERLCYTGKRGMGALEYYPINGPKGSPSIIEVDELVELANDVLNDRREMKASEDSIEDLLKVGTSAGGARAKAIIAWNKKIGHIKSGQIDAGEGYDYYLIKFDGIDNNQDKGKKDDKQYTRIEYAYYLMAKEAGIRMSHCELLKRNGLYHFVTKRFDRCVDNNGKMQKLHIQTLGALTHVDFNVPGVFDYADLLPIVSVLLGNKNALEELFSRMVFNVVARNQDDHVKNISFIMDKDGKWSLAPAYDVTYAFDPHNKCLSRHQMSINGKTADIVLDDVLAVGNHFGLKRNKMIEIIEKIQMVTCDFKEFARQAELDDSIAESIMNAFAKLI